MIKRDTHIIYNPDTGKWEVWELTPLKAFDLTQERFGVDVAVYNMNWSEDDANRNQNEDDPPAGGHDVERPG